jgi:hypothetical protein
MTPTRCANDCANGALPTGRRDDLGDGGADMIARARYWLAHHPRIGGPLKVLACLELLALLAVTVAPRALAATNAAALNWTGLHDTDNVPIGDYYLSLASLPDRITQGGPQGSGFNPANWAPWLLHGMKALLDTLTAANILTGETGIFVGIITVSLWVMRLTVSTYWLTVFGHIAQAITVAVIEVTTRWGLVVVTVPVGVFVGVLAIRRGEHGRGQTMILIAILMPTLAVTVFSDPAGMMYGPDGLLAFGRSMGFSTAQAVTHNGAISGGGFTGQLDTLSSSLITHVVREPLELFNFGHVVDQVGSCRGAYSAALLQGLPDGPVKAMGRCGDIAAVRYAQDLDGSNIVVGAALLTAALLFGWFVVSAGASVFMVSVKAMYTTAKVLPSVYAGAISGSAQQHAKATVWQYFKHPIEAMVLITFVAVMGLAVERLVSHPLPAELGGVSPFAHVVMMAGASMMALHLLRHIRADLDGHPPQRSMVGRAGEVALGLGMRAALAGAGKPAIGGAMDVRNMLGGRGKTPWERLDEQASTRPEEVLGEPLEGFVPISNGSHSNAPASQSAPPSSVPGTGRAPAGSRPGLTSASTAPAGPDVVSGAAHRVARTVTRAARSAAAAHTLAGRRPGRAAPGSAELTLGADDDDALSWAAADVAPLTEGRGGGGADTATDNDHLGADIPLPPEPLDDTAPPPPDDGGPSTTVDAITKR